MINDKIITLSHGNGGKHSHELIKNIFMSKFQNQYLQSQTDSAIIDIGKNKIAFSTDSYVVKPLFFNGGDIGKLAVTGTVNDLSVMGAFPKYLSAGFIIEEGFEIDKLDKIVQSMQIIAKECGIQLVTGDTKVVEKNSADGLFINTSGIGIIENPEINFSCSKIKSDDQVIINGTIGDHGVAIIEARQDFPVKTDIKSDCACLNGLIKNILDNIPVKEIRIMRDPTRGGLATTLNEFTNNNNFSIEINEDSIPIKDQTRSICEMTGFDPLYIANEGKVIIICSKEYSQKILEIMKNHPLGKDSSIIGKVNNVSQGNVILNTNVGGKRIVDMLVGNMLPRIC